MSGPITLAIIVIRRRGRCLCDAVLTIGPCGAVLETDGDQIKARAICPDCLAEMGAPILAAALMMLPRGTVFDATAQTVVKS